jgi:hypothetical protein
MPSFKQPTFQERAALAAKAKQKALEKLRAKAPLDDATIAARLAREAAEAEAREQRRTALEQEKAARKARALEKAAEKEKKAPVKTEAELKAERDARYAARKSRVGKR